MKNRRLASIILFVSCILLAGCGQFGLPDWSRHDEVPDDVKAQPRLVSVPPPPTDADPWPRLGDVPFKPKDFSPKPVNDHYMNELEFDRDSARVDRDTVEQEAPALSSPASAPPAPALPVAPQLPGH